MATTETRVHGGATSPGMASTAGIGAGGSSASSVSRPGAVDWIAMPLIVGGLNRGLVGAFDEDLVAAFFGTMTTLSRIVYILVELSALCAISLSTRLCRR